MISIIITSYNEPKTIGKAISSFLNQRPKNFELIITAPDKETLEVARSFAKKNKKIKIIKDERKGKPSALNNVFKIAKGDILVLSDGDVFCSENSLNLLISKLSNPHVGGVSARVIPLNDKKTMFGFWAHLSTLGFHNLRLRQSYKNENIDCSGYLYAIKSGLVKEIPSEILADDSFISKSIISFGLKTVYEPKAEVYVKYPTNLRDWVNQKKRTTGKFYQLKSFFQVSKAMSLAEEISSGLSTIKELKSIKHLFWFLFLVIMRAYIWFRIFFDRKLWKKPLLHTWTPIESTK